MWRYCIKRSQQIFCSRTDVGVGTVTISSDLFLLMGVDIYECSFTAECTVHADRAEPHFDSEARMLSVENNRPKRRSLARSPIMVY